MVAEMVASAVVGETICRISSFVIDQPEQKSSEKAKIDKERLEMAHIKMEAALHLSSKWQITEVPVLRWRRKLKRAAQECDNALHHCKQQALEDEEMRRSSFLERIAQAAKSYVSSFNRRSKAGVDESSSTCVDIRRLEWFAEGSSDFLKMVEFGRTSGRQYMFFNPLIGDLLAGKRLRYQALQGGRLYNLRMRPARFAERGVEALVWFDIKDFKEPAKSVNFRIMLRLSESSDIFGIIIKCLRSATPHFMTAAEDVRGELIQLPTQDFSRVSHTPYAENQYWEDVHSTLTHCLRPDPLCCNGHEHDPLATFSNDGTKASPSSTSTLPSMYPEEVIVLHWHCYVELSDEQKSQQLGASENGRRIRRRRTPNSGQALKLEVIVIPHDSPVVMEPAAERYALEVIDGKEQESVYKNASIQDVDEKLLPKAMDHLSQNYQSSRYQMCLMSRHGTAHLCVEKTTTQSRGRNKSSDKKHEEFAAEDISEASRDILKLWVVRASDKLHGSFSSWIVNPYVL
ncbi:hypothetical protein QYE76_023998 [Lolium multiflorum]|uniref:Uncharacterized protein n=1 Tax=Lolium multiflorum TaxID=4521 RepID=A0AAD8RCU9_LOLMU|nr:hypothetical protein QYE76_023998 [Lolium multiflorum]